MPRLVAMMDFKTAPLSRWSGRPVFGSMHTRSHLVHGLTAVARTAASDMPAALPESCLQASSAATGCSLILVEVSAFLRITFGRILSAKSSNLAREPLAERMCSMVGANITSVRD